MRMIGITGPAGAGKDTLANEILALRPNWARLALATPMKKMLVAGGLLTWEQINDRVWKEAIWQPSGQTPRRLMQTLGTEWGRNLIHPELWVRLLDVEVKKCIAASVPGVVITDLRFENEASYVRKYYGGRVVHVVRGVHRGEHESERGIRHAYSDVTIYNDGDLDDLSEKVRELMEVIYE